MEYDLVPTSDLEHVVDFSGPQLSFEFAVPDFAEDTVAAHITTAGVPWEQSRYADPTADITDPNHRATLAERYDAVGEPAPPNRVLVAVAEAVPSGEAPEGEGLTTREFPSRRSRCWRARRGRCRPPAASRRSGTSPRGTTG